MGGGQIDVLSGGFPCQPFSTAGRRKGAEDDRYLWPEFVRAINEIKPRWVVGENVAGILTMVQPSETPHVAENPSLFNEDFIQETQRQYVVETICQDLERSGYSVQPVLIPACAVGAPHRRDRVFFIAHRTDARSQTMQQERKDGVLSAPTSADTESQQGNRHQPRLSSIGYAQQVKPRRGGGQNGSREPLPQEFWRGFPNAEPAICGGDDGLPFDVDSLSIPFVEWRKRTIKAYGNAIVPQVIYEIFRAIQIQEQTT